MFEAALENLVVFFAWIPIPALLGPSETLRCRVLFAFYIWGVPKP